VIEEVDGGLIVRVLVALEVVGGREIARLLDDPGVVTGRVVPVPFTGGSGLTTAEDGANGAEVDGGWGLDTVELNIEANGGIEGVEDRLSDGKMELIKADWMEEMSPPMELRSD
jgi:hypothetical protein